MGRPLMDTERGRGRIRNVQNNGRSDDPEGICLRFCFFVCWGGGCGRVQEGNRKGLRHKGQNPVKKRIQFLVGEKTKAHLGQ